jgi:dolichyl-phosphate beta-glucosyltransferase
MEVTFSLVIPAYNEAHRLPPFLSTVRQHLDGRFAGSYEVIVVDDGSSDGMLENLNQLTASWNELVVARHETNRGKGAAVRTGILQGQGQVLLFADADGATPIEEETKLWEAIQTGADLAIGSRLVDRAEVSRRRATMRALAGRLFAGTARRWLGISVRDTQCGFKMFRRRAGRRLFSLGQETGYLFDLELLVLADRLGYQIAEVPVNWTEMPGGHLSMARELGRITVGLWRLRHRLASLDTVRD